MRLISARVSIHLHSRQLNIDMRELWLIPAPSEYEQILNEISKSRRWRRALAQRSVKMPTTRLWRQGQGLRMHKSKSIVIDSDSEMEWLEDEEDEILEEREEGAFDLDADERNLYSENSSSSEGRASDADDLESEEW